MIISIATRTAMALGTLAVLATAPLRAQEAATSAAAPKACFHPRPLPSCRSFWVTEFGFVTFVTPPPGRTEFEERRTLITWDIGWMSNRSADRATGGGIFFAANDNQLRAGVRARYRRWVAKGVPADLAPGLIVLHSDRDLEVGVSLGLAVQGEISFHDHVGLVGQLELARGGLGVQLGARVGSYLGAAAALALPMLVVLSGDDS